ncbi:hypothetical protein GYMLUDRAFT_254314 [Collybiopsis luxurians FD-317 M1]|nr:hypothetical protein GYMLUDRAFT_254314 [Collybiopsis luxurians FD-317 M1]
MGSLCSKPAHHSGGHTVLTSSDNNVVAGSNPSNPRTAAAEAAERRLKASQMRGTNASNPDRGKLASLAAKPVKNTPEPREEERLVWD